MTLPRVITEDLGGSPLARAARANLLPEWYRPRPSTSSAWADHARAVAADGERGDWLAALAPAFSATGAAAERLRRAAMGRGVVVSSGQQAALFGGPLYTLAKALSALALADALERATGIPTAPVFWAATDDADFEEACWAQVAVSGGVRTLRLESPPRAGLPMSRVPLAGIAPLVAGLEDACGSVADPAPLAAVRSSHVPGTTLGTAYVQLLRALLEPLGVAVLDASHSALRQAAAPMVRSALNRAGELEAAQRDRSARIVAAGFSPQVEYVPGLSLVFGTDADGTKRRIPTREAAPTATSLAPEAMGPNVLLRPIVERAVMPSVAYVAGPGELAYFAQVTAIADALGVSSPLAVPRWSMTILEPRIERLLERLAVSREELADPHAVETRLARSEVPPAITDALRALRRDIDGDVAALAAADRDRLVPPESVQGLRRWLLHRLERMERRYTAAMKRQGSAQLRDLATARGALWPNGVRQERALSFVPFLARYGPPLLAALREEAARHASAIVGLTSERREAGDAWPPVAERV